MWLNILLSVLLLVLSVPVGFLIAWHARDELVQGRKWFKIIMNVAELAVLILVALDELAGVLTCAFIIVVAYVSYRKSFDKKWTKKRVS